MTRRARPRGRLFTEAFRSDMREFGGFFLFALILAGAAKALGLAGVL